MPLNILFASETEDAGLWLPRLRQALPQDYLERFKLLDKMNKNAKESAKKSAMAAVAAVLLQSEFVRRAETIQQRSGTKSNWKMMRP